MLDQNSKQPTAASTSTTKTPPTDILAFSAKTPNPNALDPGGPSKAEIRAIENEAVRERAERTEVIVAELEKELDRIKSTPAGAEPVDVKEISARDKAYSHEVYGQVINARTDAEMSKRKLGRVQRDLVAGKPVRDILRQHFGVAVKTHLKLSEKM